MAGDNLTINQDERKFTYSLNKDLAGLTSVSVGTGTTETIKLDGAIGKVTAKNAVIGGVTVDGDNSHVTGLSIQHGMVQLPLVVQLLKIN